MNSTAQSRESAGDGLTQTGSALKIPGPARVLIVCDDSSETERLKSVVREAGVASECATTITAACDAAISGRFQVIVIAPRLSDGSWRRVLDVADHYGLRLEVVLWTRDCNFRSCAAALELGVFDFVDSSGSLRTAALTVKSALWAAYLNGAGAYRNVS